MKYQVVSSRFRWPEGTTLTESDLAGCNIAAAVAGGHLAPVKTRRKPVEPAETPERAEEQ